MSAYWNLCIIEKASFEQLFATGLFPRSQCCPIIPYLRLIDWKLSYGTNGCRFLFFLLWPLYCLSYDYRFSIIKRPVCSFSFCQKTLRENTRIDNDISYKILNNRHVFAKLYSLPNMLVYNISATTNEREIYESY
jgi:hypothetical protein